MGYRGRPGLPGEVRRRFWRLISVEGLIAVEAADRLGVSRRTGERWFEKAGGVIPSTVSEPTGLRLTFSEREEIAVLLAQGLSKREIARRIGRAPSTVSRELARDAARAHRGYRASTAQAEADARARRPKPAKLATSLRLRAEVQRRLRLNHSPEQIAARLVADFPGEEEMRVSHETIYRSLYVQGRGGLKRELTRHLRTGRALRKPRRSTTDRRSQIADMVNISQRPAEADDRAVPGHWEGDLIIGANQASAIGTLVERTTRFVMLLHLPGDHTATTVEQAIVAKMGQLPELLRRSLTWDQGRELTNHARISAAADLDIYFCDPHSPWQRGSNENTNGLLRQYFPKGTDLSRHGPGYLDLVATELNERPRKTLHWQTPAEALQQLLSNPTSPPGVALTG